MITIIYHVPVDQKAAELEFLHEMKIFPGMVEAWDWKTNAPTIKFACIVSPDAALTLKLRHKLDLQDNYKQR